MVVDELSFPSSGATTASGITAGTLDGSVLVSPVALPSYGGVLVWGGAVLVLRRTRRWEFSICVTK